MWRFNLVVFALLGAIFYNLSGGADYRPHDNSLQASGWTVLRSPEVTQTALAPTDSTHVVSRASVTLETLAPAPAPRTLHMPSIPALGTGAEPKFEQALQVSAERAVVLPGLTEMIATANGRPAAPLQDSAAEDEGAPDDIRRIRPARVNMRNGPGTSYSVVDKLAQGTEVRVLDSTGDWVKTRVTDSGRIGWVAANLLVAAN